jgi:hypothetical protein
MFEVIQVTRRGWWNLYIAWESEKGTLNIVEFANGKAVWMAFVQMGGWHIKLACDKFCVKVWDGLSLFKIGSSRVFL